VIGEVPTEGSQDVFTPCSLLRKAPVIQTSPEYVRPPRLIDTVPPPMVFGGPLPTPNDSALNQRLPISRSDTVDGEVDRSEHDLNSPESNTFTKGEGSPGASVEYQMSQAETVIQAPCREVKRVVGNNSAAEGADIGPGAEVSKRFICPVEGCNKSYKQANGLKYHLTYVPLLGAESVLNPSL
jgi:hypothetical protein